MPTSSTSTSSPMRLTLSALHAIEANPRYHFYQVDICDRPKLLAIVNRHRPDAIIHLAARISCRSFHHRTCRLHRHQHRWNLPSARGCAISALKIVAEGVNHLLGPNMGALVITHYQRLLEYIKPQRISILFEGRVVLTGGAELAVELERTGYESIRAQFGDKIMA